MNRLESRLARLEQKAGVDGHTPVTGFLITVVGPDTPPRLHGLQSFRHGHIARADDESEAQFKARIDAAGKNR